MGSYTALRRSCRPDAGCAGYDGSGRGRRAAPGCGQQKGYAESYRGVVTELNLLKKVRLETAVNEDFVEPTVEAIVKPDGCVRIRAGQRQRGCRLTRPPARVQRPVARREALACSRGGPSAVARRHHSNRY